MTKEITTSDYFTIITIVALGLIGLALYLIYKYKKKYTRERFLTTAWLGIITMSFTYLNMLMTSQYPWDIFLKFKGIEVITNKPDFSDKVLGFLVIVSCIWLLQKIYSGWNINKSEYQKEKESFGRESNILFDMLEILTNKELRKKSKQKALSVPNHIASIIPTQIDKKRPWVERAIELFLLAHPYYEQDHLSGCYETQNLYIINNIDTKELTVLFCLPTFPPKIIQEQLKDFLCNREQKYNELIFFVEKESEDKIYINYFKNSKLIVEDKIIDQLSDLKNYHNYLKNEFCRNQFGNKENLSIKDIYCKSSGVINSENIKNVNQYILRWVEENSRRQLAILGEYGQGKSVLSLKVALDIFERKGQLQRTPIIIELRGKSPRNLSVYELLAVWSENYHVNPEITRLLYETNRLVIIFDAFDEMDRIGDPEVRMQHFRSLWRFAAHSKSKVIITGRPNFFLDEVNLKQSLGIQEASISFPYCEALVLNKFKTKEISIALRNFDSDIKKDILQLCENNHHSNSFIDLISRPSTLTLVASIWGQIKELITKGGATSAQIIKEFINYTYLREYEKSLNDIEAKPTLSISEREYFMFGIAIVMLKESGHQNQISSEDLQFNILRLLDKIPENLSSINSIFDSMEQPLKKRIENLQHGNESVINDVCTSGILVHDPSKTNSFRFSHKSFYEFLVAYVVYNFYVDTTDEKDILIRDSLESYYLPSIERVMTQEIAVFIGQLMSKKAPTNFDNKERARYLLHKLFPTNSFEGLTRKTCLRMMQSNLSKILGPYIILFMRPLNGRLRVFAAYCIVELKLTEEELSGVIGKQITSLILNPNKRGFFSIADRIFHRNFNLLETLEGEKKNK